MRSGLPATQVWFPLGATGSSRNAAEGMLFAGAHGVLSRRTNATAAQFFGGSSTPAPAVFKPEEQFGACEPLGFFDPLGFSTAGDESYFRGLREAELKHGRVAMIAAVGFYAEHLAKIPGFEGAPEGIVNAFDTASEAEVLPWVLLLCGWLELGPLKQDAKVEPGNFNDPLNFGKYTAEMRLKELNNGRMATVAVALIIGEEMRSGLPATSVWFPLGATKSARKVGEGMLFAGARGVLSRRTDATAAQFFGGSSTPAPAVFKPEEQFGSCEPLGFFDPLGFSAAADESYFRGLRVAELKYGRVAMIAAVGFYAEHLAKIPGFEGAPEGIVNAFGTASEADVLPLVLMICGWLEFGPFKQDSKVEPGNFGDPLKFAQYTDEMRLK